MSHSLGIFVGVQPSPLDFMQADEALTPDALQAAHSAQSMWTLENCYPLLPYSAVVLESVERREIPPSHLALSRNLTRPRDAHKNNGSGPVPAG